MSRGHGRAFSNDVTEAILVLLNSGTATTLNLYPASSGFSRPDATRVSQTNPLGVELFSYVNALFCSNKFA